MEPDSETKLVRVSGGASRACFFMRSNYMLGFGLVCELPSMGFPRSILKVLS